MFLNYETIQWELNKRLKYKCRCDERLKARAEDAVDHYATIKRETSKRLLYECRCDARLTDKTERSTLLTCTVAWGTGTPKDKDEDNRREVSECDGWVCVCETIVVSSKFRVTRKPAVLVRRLLNFDLRIEENTSRDLQHVITLGLFIVVYYESSWEIYTSRIHWLARGIGTPKNKDEINRRDVSEWDGWVCVFEVIDVPSMFKLIRKAAALTRVLPTLFVYY